MVYKTTLNEPSWTDQTGGIFDDEAASVATTCDGQIYSVGSIGEKYSSGATISNGFLDKYDVSGNRMGAQPVAIASTPQRSTIYDDMALGVTVFDCNEDAVVYVVGKTKGVLESGVSNSGPYDAFVARYANDGTRAWIKQFGGTNSAGTKGSYNDVATAVTTDDARDVHVVGYTLGILNMTDGSQANFKNKDLFVSKYSADGVRIWIRQLRTSQHDEAFSVAAGSDGSIYVAGYANGDLDNS